ncbi:MAG: hypothetical protein ABIS03_14465 [Gemmatimonadaceae bacterium]
MKARVMISMLSFFPVLASAQTSPPVSAARQIAAAVSALPENLQAGAKVYGYSASGKFITLKPGTNDMVCVADDPAGKLFHVASYHQSLEPFMARGRQRHALKKKPESIDSARLADLKARRYSMPSKPAALYQYFAPRDSVDMASGTVRAAEYLYVIYMPYATYGTTGISENPLDGGPWVMDAGKPWAHVMVQPQKPATVKLK